MTRPIILALTCLLLPACTVTRPNTAMELIEQQQEQQTQMRMAEARAARDNAPSQAGLMLDVIREAHRGGRYFAVLAYARQYIAQHGHTPELDILYANALTRTGQDETGRSLYESLLRGPMQARARHGLGLLAAHAGRHEEAIRELSRAVALEPANPTFLGDLGFAQLRAGDLNGAGLSLGQAAELAPDDTRILGNMAVLLLLRGQPAQADSLMNAANFSAQARQHILALAARLRHPDPAADPPSASAPRVTPGRTLPSVPAHPRLTR